MIHDQQLALAVQLHDEETFDNFIGNTNAQLLADLRYFVDKDNSRLSSFYMFGNSGVGKSHLINAAATLANEQKQSVLCLSSKEIINMPTEVLDGLEQLDLICLDDVHFLAEHPVWQQAVFDLFNRITEQGKKILLSGNNTPNELNLTLPDLVSRLTWGQVSQLKVMPDEEKVQAIRHRAATRGMVFPKEAVNYLINRYSRDMSKLIACLKRLDQLSIQSQRKITIPFLKDALPEL